MVHAGRSNLVIMVLQGVTWVIFIGFRMGPVGHLRDYQVVLLLLSEFVLGLTVGHVVCRGVVELSLLMLVALIWN